MTELIVPEARIPKPEHNIYMSQIPELRQLLGVEQGGRHFYDVFGHTSTVALRVRTLALQEGASALRLRRLTLAALLHDIEKPGTQCARADGHGFSFIGHDVKGEPTTRTILTRLGVDSSAEIERIAVLVREHLRPAFLAREPNPSGRAIRRLGRDIGEVDLIHDLVLLASADEFGKKGENHTDFEEYARYERVLYRIEAVAIAQPL